MKKSIADDRKEGNVSESAQRLKSDFKKVRDQIANHPAQRIILSEIESQLKTFHTYATSKKKEVAANEYARILSIIEGVLRNKKEGAEPVDEPSDNIHRMIVAKAEAIMSL
jgi:hypothetical protein